MFYPLKLESHKHTLFAMTS